MHLDFIAYDNEGNIARVQGKGDKEGKREKKRMRGKSDKGNGKFPAYRIIERIISGKGE